MLICIIAIRDQNIRLDGVPVQMTDAEASLIDDIYDNPSNFDGRLPANLLYHGTQFRYCQDLAIDGMVSIPVYFANDADPNAVYVFDRALRGFFRLPNVFQTMRR